MIRLGSRFAAALLASFVFIAEAGAQSYVPIAFPDQPVENANELATGTAFGKPAGAGPFPALVILESCSGATADLRRWGQSAMAQGYVVMVVDSMGPRGSTPRNCNVSPLIRIADAMNARARLESFPFVDKARIGVLGFSVGGHIAQIIAADGTRRASPAPGMPALRPFAAAASIYGPCIGRTPNGMQGVFEDATGLNEPLLAQLGDADTQARPAECVPQYEKMKTAGADIDWVVYPGITHCFDCAGLNGMVAVDAIHGGSLLFRYDAEITATAEKRLFAFFAAKMKGGT